MLHILSAISPEQNAITTAIYVLSPEYIGKRRIVHSHTEHSAKILPIAIEPTLPKDVKYPFITDDTAVHIRVGERIFKHMLHSGLLRIFADIKSEA